MIKNITIVNLGVFGDESKVQRISNINFST